MDALKIQLPQQVTRALRNAVYQHEWVVYAKEPFERPHTVIEYLGRYTHKIAISNYRLKKYENGKVDFTYKDYRHGHMVKTMSLGDMEFIRRFSLHILPKGFMRIRHYGILSSSSKKKCAVLIKAQLPRVKIPLSKKSKAKPEPYDRNECPCCKQPAMRLLINFKNKPPPPVNLEKLAADILAGCKRSLYI